MDFLVRLIGTFGYTGFFPVGPATFASFIFVLIYAFVPGGEVVVHPIVCVVTLVVSIPVSTRMEKFYGKDPGCVVIDEIVGMQAVLVGASGVGLWGLAAAFALFRVFDIAKPFPAGRSQHLPGGWGIVIDDVVAGIYARISVILLSLLIPSLGGFVPWGG